MSVLKTFRAQLIAMAVISLISFLILGLFSYSSSKETKELFELKNEVKNYSKQCARIA
ncbi:MAG: hypothetical protein OQK48_01010 [Sulfurimonas sp.]|nr:hypothetical protein [Sulfurimonas sp.]